MNIKEIRFECEKFADKLMELNPNIYIDFSVFDPEEMRRDFEKSRDEEYNEYSMTHTAYRDDQKGE